MSSENINNSGVIFSLRRLWFHLRKKRKYQLFALFFLILLSGLTEALSIAALIPFLSFIIDEKSIYDIGIIVNVIDYFQITNTNNILKLVVVLFASSVFLAVFIRVLTAYLTLKISNNIGHDFNTYIFSNIINQSYEKHLKIDNNNIIACSTDYLSRTIKVITSAINIFSNSVVTIFILFALVKVDFKSALLAATIFFGSYFLISSFTKKRYILNSKKIGKATKDLLKNIRNALFSIREIKLDPKIKKIYKLDHRYTDYSLRQANTNSNFLSIAPRYFIELILFLTIALVGYLIRQSNTEVTSMLTILGSFGMASQKLLPSIQKIYSSWAIIKTQEVSVMNVLNELENYNKRNKIILKKKKKSEKINFNRNITFKNVYFSYEIKNGFDLEDINFQLLKGERLGIIGESGSGKSTIIDLMLNLLKPNKGLITIDDNLLTEEITYDLFSHVPQNPFIKSGTFAENIAFGINPKEVNFVKLKKAATLANINKFIENKPKKYETFINEFGSNLSGGQKQRIAIARAFYKDSKIIIFDEATSGLDYKTSLEINNELFNISRDFTFVIIAHDFSAIQKCDRVLKIKNGKIESTGLPKQIL